MIAVAWYHKIMSDGNAQSLYHDSGQTGAGLVRICHAVPILLGIASLAGNILFPDGRPWLSRLRQSLRMARTLAAGDVAGSEGRNFEGIIRELATRAPAGAEMAIVVENEEHPQPVERTVHQAAAFERLPCRTVMATAFNAVAFDAIIAPMLVGDEPANDFPAYGFSLSTNTASFELWVKDGAMSTYGVEAQPRWATVRHDLRSVLGVLALLVLIAGGLVALGLAGGPIVALLASYSLFAMLAVGAQPSRLIAAIAIAIGAAPLVFHGIPRAGGLGAAREREDGGLAEKCVAAPFWCLFAAVSLVLTLGHTYSAPNGLGVVGGRAMLWFSSGDFCSSFCVGHAFDTFQPAYPPGLALLALLSHSLSGVGNDWQTQLLGLAPFWVLLWLFLARAGSTGMRLLALALFLNPVCLDMASGFYPEGWEVLFAVVGLDMLLDGRTVAAWPIIVASGWFKAEGLVFAFALFLAVRLALGRERAGFGLFAASCLVPLSWWVFALAHGAGVFEYAAPWAPRPTAIPAIAKAMAAECLLRPWRTAFALPLLAIGAVCPKAAFWRCRKQGSLAASFAVFAIAALAWIFALSRADLEWHLWSALPRLIWCVSAIALFACLNPKRPWATLT